MQRFAGLNIRSFSPIRFSRKYFCGALASSVYCLTTAKHSLENFGGALKNMKTTKVYCSESIAIYASVCLHACIDNRLPPI